MTAHSHANTVPRGALVLAGALVATTLAATIAFRVAGVHPAADPIAERSAAQVRALSTRQLRFADRADGAVVISRSGAAPVILPAGGQSGFIRGVMRGLARDRAMRGISPAEPFALTGWADGGLSLTDLVTGRTVELNGFGPDNRAEFAALLEPSR